MLVFGNTCLCSDIPKLLLNVLGTHVCVLIFLSVYLMFLLNVLGAYVCVLIFLSFYLMF